MSQTTLEDCVVVPYWKAVISDYWKLYGQGNVLLLGAYTPYHWLFDLT